jgi:hypothetical protein
MAEAGVQRFLNAVSSVPLGRVIILSRIPGNQLPGYYRGVLPGRLGRRL